VSDLSDDLEELEEALRAVSSGTYVLKLYVSGSTTKSATAISNVRQMCESYLSGRFELEIIDVFQQPELAIESQLLAAPTLIREQPAPIRKVVGDMSNEDKLLYSLNIRRAQS
jgi:circadian clock protein KaiB